MLSNKVAARIHNLVRLAIALILAMIAGGIVLRIAGFNPFQAYGLIFKGAFGGWNAFLTTLIYATPMLFTGLAYIVGAQGSAINLGLEGQLYIGAMVGALVGAYVPGLPGWVHLPLVLLCATVAGGLYAGLAGFLKVKFGANLVIVTIMMNYVAQLFCGYLVSYPFRDPQGQTQTKRILETAEIGRLFEGNSLSVAIIFALMLILLFHWIMKNTVIGFRIRACGKNQLAAETAGINSNRVAVMTMFCSGAVAGLGGALLVSGTYYRFIMDFSAGYGFEGVAVATLAGLNPLGLIVSGILWGGIKSGAVSVNRIASIPMDVIAIIQALVVILVAAPKVTDAILKPFLKLGKKRSDVK